MMDGRKPSKVTKKDRYGNSITMEYAPEVKPLDPTALAKHAMDQDMEVPEIAIMQGAKSNHPGEPQGSDTVPAWLTPGEFVVNAEAMRIPGAQEAVESINDQGRAIQQMQGGSIPSAGYNTGGQVPFIAGPRLNAEYLNEGSWVTDELLDKLAFVESSNNNDAVSKAGAIGKYQWLPSSAKQAGYGVKAFDPKDEKAARAATKMYLENMAKYHGFTPEEALRAYNWGPGNVLKHKAGKRKDIPAEALNYPGKILGFDKVEGVPAPEGMPVPTPRPQANVEVPTSRPVPKEEGIDWKGLLNKYILGEKTQLFDNGGHVIHPEIKTGGHQMFGGNLNLAGEPVVQGPPPKEDPWYAPLLGHKSKEALGLDLDPNEARLYHEANPSLVGDDPATVDIESDIEGTAGAEKEKITTVPGESLAGQVDDLKGATGEVKESDAEIVGNADGDVALKDDVQKNILNKINEADLKNPNSTGPGSDQKGPNASDKDLEDAAAKDPSLVEKAGGFLKSAFGDLFDGKELARAAILYAGSRALGYSHTGSLNHIAKNYLTRVDAKADAKIKAAATRDKRAFELAKTDKFTPASVNAYKKSGNPIDLVSKTATAGAIPTGVTEQRLVGGKKVSVQQVKLPNGSIGFQIPGKGVVTKAQLENATKPYDASFDKGTSEYRTRRSRSIKSSTNIFKEIQGREDSYKKDDETKYNTDILPQQAAQDFWVFAEKYGIDPESDEALDIMGQAYRQAIQQSSIEGAPRARDLKPFLEAQYIRQQTSAPQLFQVNPDKDVKENAKYVRSDKMAELTRLVDSVGQVVPGAKRNQIIDSLVTDWGALGEKEQAQWNRKANKGIETGFYLYAKDRAHNYLIDKKIGE